MSERTYKTDRSKIKPDLNKEADVTTLDLNNLPPLTQAELEMLRCLDSLTDSEVRSAAISDPDAQPLV